MLISKKFKNKKPLISFEIFPPKVDSPIDTIYSTIDDLNELKPDFISVTYGAGGSTKGHTVDISSYISGEYNLSSLAHLTCIDSSKEELDRTLDLLEDKQITNILALRGDYPEGLNMESLHKREFRYAIDLIQYIKANRDFCIGGACYPEKHIEAPDMDSDLKHLKDKVDAGVDFLISQLFFDNEKFYDFMDKTEKLNIDIPIIPGIMPVLNKNQINRIVDLSGCNLPKKFTRILDRYEHNAEALAQAGIAYAVEQIIDLLSWGIDGVHIYTMNKPVIVRGIMESISKIRGVLTNEQLSILQKE